MESPILKADTGQFTVLPTAAEMELGVRRRGWKKGTSVLDRKDSHRPEVSEFIAGANQREGRARGASPCLLNSWAGQ